MNVTTKDVAHALKKLSTEAQAVAQKLMTDHKGGAISALLIAKVTADALEVIEQQDKEIATLKSQLAAATKGPAVH
ncbi:hypothetical protein [Escherichia coli]|uniref:hypothetical protein n=1 Tax=Escherichia coli TaxID=562 RepID=UPI00135DD7D7|nr:hypothetical protein [Escherichia coli]MXF04519.1 hypothetical protein [Escherichia coli]